MAANDASLGSRKLAIFMTGAAAFGGFLYGYDTGYISGLKVMPFFARTFGVPTTNAATGVISYALSSQTNSLITSILSAGTFFGALGAAPIGDRLGRRYGILAYLVLFCIGVALQTGSSTLAPFVVGRVFAGLGVGGTSCLVPLYQSECSPPQIRGAIVAGYQWMITIGLLIAAVVVNSTQYINSPVSYQLPIALQFIWAAILALGIVVLPESPRWLILKGREEAALQSLSRILAVPVDSPILTQEYAGIAANLHHERDVGNASYLDCFRNGPGRNGLRMWTGLGIQALQQLTGINFIFYYGTAYFQNAGLDNPFVITIITNVVNVVMTLPGIYLVDKLGRRPLLMTGAVVMAGSQIIVAAVGISVSTGNLAGQRVLIAFVCIFIAAFASTWGCLAWVVTTEIYPLSNRTKMMSMSTASNWLFNFAIGYATPYLVDTGAGNAGLRSNVFFIWGGCCVLCFFFSFFLVPETKGLSLEQVDILYHNSSILGSNKYRQKILDEDIHNEDMDAYAQPKTNTKVEHAEDIKSEPSV